MMRPYAPVRGFKNVRMIETITTVEIKFGAYATVWTNFLKRSEGISLIIKARIIGAENPSSIPNPLNTRVFRINRQASGMEKNHLKLSKPTQGLPQMP